MSYDPPPAAGRPPGWRPRPAPEQPTAFIPKIDVLAQGRPGTKFGRRPEDDDTGRIDDFATDNFGAEDFEEPADDAPPPKDTARRVVRTFGELFITAGLVILLFVVYEVYWTDLISAGKQNQATSSLNDKWKDQDTVGTGPQRGTHYDLTEGQGFAKIYVPALGADYHFTIVEGTTDADLDIGPGHYIGSALPGQPGDFAVAGHRVGKGAPFNDLDLVSSCDAIVVETSTDWFVYRMLPTSGEVAGWAAGKGAQPQCKGVAPLGGPYAGLVGQETVLPSEGDVIAPVPHKANLQLPAGQQVALMTLTTCTPKFSASHRLILHAVLTNQYAKDPKNPDKAPPELKETD
ncbi:class E sortase [Kutzneria buriramensis]|uniref:LPXTG-site transpeptidase (Sortase) family protein n=1 Tax=Kutzneria buriramensis TaxID=1045776 RepID=A0A3E0HUF3_9PSEU|nr:class E sortase [Kutzneria buriramensis]REH49900.1 LPXTG-site transpeptidase (sortase) family protein [Kutzneria buriramensis]